MAQIQDSRAAKQDKPDNSVEFQPIEKTTIPGEIVDQVLSMLMTRKLKAGDRLAFTDMSHYTMVKNNTFNGIRLPSIAVYDPDAEEVRIIREFGYEDYRNRLS